METPKLKKIKVDKIYPSIVENLINNSCEGCYFNVPGDPCIAMPEINCWNDDNPKQPIIYVEDKEAK